MRWFRKNMVALLVASSLFGLMAPASSIGAQNGNYTIYLQPLDANSGTPIYDACFVLVNASNEGCDENGDGMIRFAEIDPGTYTVSQTQAANGYQWMSETTITVGNRDDGRAYPIYLTPSGGGGGLVHVALVTRDPSDGELVTGTCYIIVNASIEGCDENGDGQVDFADVTPGTYTVRQTRTPAGYPTVREFPIRITDDPNQAFPIKQAARQNDASHRTLSVVLTDRASGVRVTGPDACVQIVGASEIGCDDNGDGQIDFLDIPVGTRTVRFVSLPRGWGVENDTYTISVDAGQYPNVTVYLSPFRM